VGRCVVGTVGYGLGCLSWSAELLGTEQLRNPATRKRFYRFRVDNFCQLPVGMAPTARSNVRPSLNIQDRGDGCVPVIELRGRGVCRRRFSLARMIFNGSSRQPLDDRADDRQGPHQGPEIDEGRAAPRENLGQSRCRQSLLYCSVSICQCVLRCENPAGLGRIQSVVPGIQPDQLLLLRMLCSGAE